MYNMSTYIISYIRADIPGSTPLYNRYVCPVEWGKFLERRKDEIGNVYEFQIQTKRLPHPGISFNVVCEIRINYRIYATVSYLFDALNLQLKAAGSFVGICMELRTLYVLVFDLIIISLV